MHADQQSGPVVGVSSWALHDSLGNPPFYGPERGTSMPAPEKPQGAYSLLELPGLVSRLHFQTLQLCHFHLPSRDPAYLHDLRQAIANSGLALHALLVDDGDLTSQEFGQRDFEWISGWLDVAGKLGAAEVRVIAGKTVGQGALSRSATALRQLAGQARDLGLKLTTENWFDLLSTPAVVKELLARGEGEIEFLLDFGNWEGAGKYADLAVIAPFASSCHAKAEHANGSAFDENDYLQCLALPYAPGFAGPFHLVSGGLDGVPALRDFIRKNFRN